MKQFIQAYFNFTKKERRGILTLCSFIIVISFLPSIFHFFIIQILYIQYIHFVYGSLFIQFTFYNSNF